MPQFVIEKRDENNYHIYIPDPENLPKWEARVSRTSNGQHWDIRVLDRGKWDIESPKNNTDEARALGYAIMEALKEGAV